MGKRSKLEGYLSSAEAAEDAKIGRKGILAAIYDKRLNAHFFKGRWFIKKDDLDKYRLERNSILKRKSQGELIFDIDKGELSLPQAAHFISHLRGKRVSNVYLNLLIHQGEIKAFKRGMFWVIMKDDAVSLAKKMIEKEEKTLVT